MDTTAFVLTDRETGRAVARALVCVEARYASVWPQNAPRPDRRHVSPADWRHPERVHHQTGSVRNLPIAKAHACRCGSSLRHGTETTASPGSLSARTRARRRCPREEPGD